MSVPLRLASIILVFALTPGAGELLENAAHLVVDGHLAHDTEHLAEGQDEHGPSGDEHGCNSVFHVCSCHVSPSFVLQERGQAVASAAPVVLSWGGDLYESLDADGVTRSLLRPPIT